MLSIQKPSTEALREFLENQSKLDFTYSGNGPLDGVPPAGFVLDHTRIKLGEGEKVYEAAKNALRRWDQFRIGWVEAGPKDTPIRKGADVAVLAQALGLWWLNACRIISVVEEVEAVRRFGFTYGTLPGHIGIGEERFLIEWDESDNSVWYDILAFSRPRHFLAKVGYPFVRWTQKRFGRDSSAAMLRAVVNFK